MTVSLSPRAGDAARIPTPREQVARHYDELDAFYRDIWGEHVHHGFWRTGRESPEQAVEQLVDHVADALALRAGEAVVDVGAGYGATARHLAARRGVRITGFTVSSSQHAYAVQRDGADCTNPKMVLRDWHTNRLPSDSVDAVLAIESTEHMEDLPLALSEMRRVLRPGGRLAVCAWLTADAPPAWQRRLLTEPIRREGRLVTMGNEAEIAGLLRDSGFAGVTFEDLTVGVRRTWSICLRRLAGRLATDARYRRYALRATNGERVFAATMVRILTAYHVGAMRYGLFLGRSPA